jgi:ArsR family transcriptional regulator
VRLLSLLEHGELTVAELTAVTQLTQSRVSTHLARLREAGLVRDRKAGASVFYALNRDAMPEAAGQLWALVKTQMRDAVLASDVERMREIQRARDKRGSWPELVAGEMERHYSPGRTWEALCRGLCGLIDAGDVLDLGSGDGTVAQLLAPHARSVTCVDQSARVIDAARKRLDGIDHVRCLEADMHDVPLPDASFDQVLMLHVLACSHTPAKAIAEAARLLRPDGTLSIVTLATHAHLETTQAYGHVRAGFTATALRKLLLESALDVRQCEVTSREHREPNFQVITAIARKPVRSRRNARQRHD